WMFAFPNRPRPRRRRNWEAVSRDGSDRRDERARIGPIGCIRPILSSPGRKFIWSFRRKYGKIINFGVKSTPKTTLYPPTLRKINDLRRSRFSATRTSGKK